MKNATVGRGLRDAGIATVMDNAHDEWKESYRLHVELWFDMLKPGSTFSGEQLRIAAKGIGEPHHPNAWAGAASSCLRQWQKEERIVVTGHYVLASSPSRHANAMRQYRKIS